MTEAQKPGPKKGATYSKTHQGICACGCGRTFEGIATRVYFDKVCRTRHTRQLAREVRP